MIAGSIKTATVASGQTVSGAVDLGRPYEWLQMDVPTIDSGTVTFQVADLTGSYVALQHLTPTAAGHFTPGTTAGVGGIAALVRLGGYQFIKVVCGASQTAARTFSLRGLNP